MSCTSNKLQFLSVTSNAVSPGQKSQTQHSVAQTQHHSEHVQEADHLWGYGADQHCTHHKPQEGKELKRERVKIRLVAGKQHFVLLKHYI